jgi:hypothetical protein
MQLTRLCVALAFSAAGVACSGGPASTSDPNSWNPLSTRVDGSSESPEGGGVVFDPACLAEPPFDPSVVASRPGAISHLSGQPCLEGCHEPGGEARSAFAVGGTVFRSQTSRVVAQSGFVDGVGGTKLEVDACGNIYAKASELRTKLTATSPFVTVPAFRRMDKTLRGAENPGSCNQAGCHDFSSRLRWGIYF